MSRIDKNNYYDRRLNIGCCGNCHYSGIHWYERETDCWWNFCFYPGHRNLKEDDLLYERLECDCFLEEPSEGIDSPTLFCKKCGYKILKDMIIKGTHMCARCNELTEYEKLLDQKYGKQGTHTSKMKKVNHRCSCLRHAKK